MLNEQIHNFDSGLLHNLVSKIYKINLFNFTNWTKQITIKFSVENIPLNWTNAIWINTGMEAIFIQLLQFLIILKNY